ncbi:MAG TPA: hypothetical protein PK733_18390 [Clostridiales bacterium]|nr:hypothetical protein [Clostridiales bacterium]
MEKYRKTIRKRMILCGFLAAVAVGLGILHQSEFFDLISLYTPNEALAGFQAGLLSGFGVLSLLLLYKYGKAVKDDTKLKILYNKEYDERQNLIRQKAGMPMLMITSGIMIFAGIIAGYLNEIVFYTLILAAMIQLTLGAMVKIYYMRKM